MHVLKILQGDEQETIKRGKCSVLGNTKDDCPRAKVVMKIYSYSYNDRDRNRDIYSTGLADLLEENQGGL